jgi:hypothetical protein
MPFRSQLYIGYSSTFKKQSAFGTPLGPSEIDKVIPATLNSISHVDLTEQNEAVPTCDGQYPADLIRLHRLARLSIDVQPDAQNVGGILATAGGSAAAPTGSGPYTHVISMLGATVFTLPYQTLIVKYQDGSDAGVILQDAITESIELTAQFDQLLRVRWNLVGNGLLPSASGYTLPECSLIDALRFDSNALMTINSVEYINSTKRYTFSYSNNPPLNDFPFTLASPDIQRMARGDQRPISLRPSILGALTGTLGAAARTIPVTKYPFTVRIGSATSGVTIAAASALVKIQNPLQGFEGEKPEAAVNLDLEPVKIPGNAATPVQFTITNNQSTAYLVTGTP